MEIIKNINTIADEPLEQQLQWIYANEFGDEKRDESYYRKFKAIQERSQLNRSQLIVLSWFLATEGVEFSSEDAAAQIGITVREMERITFDLFLHSLITDDYSEINRDGITSFYEKKARSLESLNNLVQKRTHQLQKPEKSHFQTEEEIHNRLQALAKEYVSDGDAFMGEQDFLGIEDFVNQNPECVLSLGYNQIIPSFSDNEKKAFFLLAGHFIWRGIMPLEYSTQSLYFDAFDTLIQAGWACVVPQDSESDRNSHGGENRIILSPGACRGLFYGHREFIKYSDISRQAELIKYEDIQAKELFYEECDQRVVTTLYRIVNEELYTAITNRLAQKGRPRGITAILYGGPGLGKTELIKQLARVSSRDIFNVDISRVNESSWGGAEKNVRALFRKYRYMAAICPHAPILLFNEADGILKERGSGGNSGIDHAEDIVQTIILQELEDFEGFFFATTNIADKMDKAYVRRFLFKLGLHSPGTETRVKIWRSMDTDLDSETIHRIAEKYTFSGGQILNIARRIDIFEAIEGCSPGIQEMMEFCQEELEDQKEKTKIGFVCGYR